jgi:signal transduction histidine kinase
MPSSRVTSEQALRMEERLSEMERQNRRLLAQLAEVEAERRRTERRVAERDANLALALTRSSICVFEQDRDLRFKWINNEMVEADHCDFSKSDVDSYLPQSSISVMNADKQRVLQTGERTRSELSMVLRGEERQLVVAHEPARGPTGEIVGLIGTMVDVTEEKRSRKELAEALAFRDRVIGILGHDLRNPLSAIAALARSTMRREDLPSGVQERMVQVDRAANRSLAMIETLLDFSESRFRGALTTRVVASEPSAIATRVIDELRATYPERVILLEISGSDRFDLDPVRMAQVLSNLVSNALVHGARDTPVEVAIEVGAAEARLAVRNRGPVIPPQGIASLFEPFTQGQAPGEGERPPGLGLGLYIVREIVAAHAGTISVESDADRGTTFVVRLPRPRLGKGEPLAAGLPADEGRVVVHSS